MELTLKTLTPVHIGNGEKLYALDYVIHNGTYYRITQNQFLKFLGNDPQLISAYAQWIEETAGRIADLDRNKKDTRDSQQKQDYNQKLNLERERFNLMAFAQKAKRQNEFITFLNSQAKTKISTDIKTSNQVRGMLKTGIEQIYLPATSLKGSVRTALLHHFLTNANENNIKQLIQKQFQKIQGERDMERAKKMLDELIDQEVFYCGIEQKDGSIKYTDEKMDMMKWVSFSDGILSNRIHSLGLGKVDLYMVQRDRDGIFTANLQPQAPIVEYILENQIVSCSFNFQIEFLLAIKEKIQYEGNTSFIGIEGKKHWVNIYQKVKSLFGLDIYTLTKENIENKRKEVLNYILQRIYDFSQAQMQVDKLWFENFKDNDKINKYHFKMKKGFDLLTNQHRTIHLGYATGFCGTTALLYIKNSNSTELKALFEQIMLHFKLGNNPNNKGGYKPNIRKFPKSRRLITEPGIIKPLGWLAIYEQGEKIDLTPIREDISTANPLPTKPKPSYFKGKLKIGAEIEAEVNKSGKPNKVKLYISEGNEPEMVLTGYKSEITEGTIIIVRVSQIDKQNNIREVLFSNFKK